MKCELAVKSLGEKKENYSKSVVEVSCSPCGFEWSKFACRFFAGCALPRCSFHPPPPRSLPVVVVVTAITTRHCMALSLFCRSRNAFRRSENSNNTWWLLLGLATRTSFRRVAANALPISSVHLGRFLGVASIEVFPRSSDITVWAIN